MRGETRVGETGNKYTTVWLNLELIVHVNGCRTAFEWCPLKLVYEHTKVHRERPEADFCGW
jgi:hypothetical protein